nr:unnamed protein product [Spirometra erinaceieuropaei]
MPESQKSGSGMSVPHKVLGSWGEDNTNDLTQYYLCDSDRADDKFSIVDAESDDEPDIPTIPETGDIDESCTEEEISCAPSLLATRLPTYWKLDEESTKCSALAFLVKKLLSSFLDPEEETKEEDEVWSWDRLFADIMN